MERAELLRRIADAIESMHLPHPVRVGIDGVDAAGKTTLADDLSRSIADRRPVIRASIDGFHRPRAERYRRGRTSPEGYYRDSFDHEAVICELLRPLGPNGHLQFRTRVFDFLADSATDAAVQIASPDAIFLMDGVFLFRPELVAHWDLRIFIDADFSVTIPRAIARDLAADASLQLAELEELYRTRYAAGQELYFREADPRASAHLIIDGMDLNHPNISKAAGSMRELSIE